MPEEIKLIQPAPVVRDEYSMFPHPDMPDFDEGDGDKCKAWRDEEPSELAYDQGSNVGTAYALVADSTTGARVWMLTPCGLIGN